MNGSRFVLHPSRIFAAAILAAHGAAAACLAVSFPGWAGAALAAALMVLGCHAAWRRALLRSPASPRALVVSDKGLEVERRDGRTLGAKGPGGYVGRFLVTLAVEKSTLLVTRDMLRAEEFRRLRLWALWGRLPRRSVAAAQL